MHMQSVCSLPHLNNTLACIKPTLLLKDSYDDEDESVRDINVDDHDDLAAKSIAGKKSKTTTRKAAQKLSTSGAKKKSIKLPLAAAAVGKSKGKKQSSSKGKEQDSSAADSSAAESSSSSSSAYKPDMKKPAGKRRHIQASSSSDDDTSPSPPKKKRKKVIVPGTYPDTDSSDDDNSVASKPLRKALRTVVCPHETMVLDASTMIPHHIEIDPTSGLYDIHQKMSRKKVLAPECKFPMLTDCYEKKNFGVWGVTWSYSTTGNRLPRLVETKTDHDLVRNHLLHSLGVGPKKLGKKDMPLTTNQTLCAEFGGCVPKSKKGDQTPRAIVCDSFPAALFNCPKYMYLKRGPDTSNPEVIILFVTIIWISSMIDICCSLCLFVSWCRFL